jgi:hypothetical protein
LFLPQADVGHADSQQSLKDIVQCVSLILVARPPAQCTFSSSVNSAGGISQRLTEASIPSLQLPTLCTGPESLLKYLPPTLPTCAVGENFGRLTNVRLRANSMSGGSPALLEAHGMLQTHQTSAFETTHKHCAPLFSKFPVVVRITNVAFHLPKQVLQFHLSASTRLLPLPSTRSQHRGHGNTHEGEARSQGAPKGR